MITLPTPASAPATGPTLRDIHLPPSPSWWPPAPGWWIVAALLVLGAVVALWAWRRRQRVVAARRRVLSQVDTLAKQYRHGGDQAALAAGLHQLLRRVARQHDPDAARQTGPAWRHTLARVPLNASSLDRLLALDEQMYRADASFDHAVVANDVRAWLRLALNPSAWKTPAAEQADD